MQNQTWDLSQYELHRTPQEAITDSTEITVSQRTLHNELMCPICLDMLKNTMTTKECLHRFCQECITRALRNVNRECPTCRKKLVSRRSLRADPNFDALIAKIYPSRDEYEEQQERLMMRIKEQHNTKELTATLTEGIRLQKMSNPPRPIKRFGEEDDDTGAKRPRDADGGYEYGDFPGDVDGSPQEMEVDLVLCPHPESDEDKLKRRYIKTTANATMFHLAKFVSLRLWLEAHRGGEVPDKPPPQPDDTTNEFEISIMVDDAHSSLEGSLTLDEITEKYWKSVADMKPVELYYRRVKLDS